MPNSYILMFLLAVVGIILSLIFFKNASYNEKQFRAEEEAKEWARKWNEQRAKDICDNDCLWCGNNQFCKLKDAQ